MFALSTILIAGGVAYSGSIAYKRLRMRHNPLRWPRRAKQIQRIMYTREEPVTHDSTLKRANRTLTLSSLSLGVTVVGVLMKPALMLVSVPTALVIFAPSFQAAWQALRQERRIAPSALDATRVMLCIILGYYVALALDTWLRTLAQRLFLRAEAEFQYTLDQHFVESPSAVWCFTGGAEVQTPITDLAVGDIVSVATGELIPADGVILYGFAWVDERLTNGHGQVVRKATGDAVSASTLVQNGQIYLQITATGKLLGTTAVRKRLEAMVQSGSHLAEAGKRSGEAMALPMWVASAVLLPFWDPNRAAGFLTTSFGNQMERLGPYALQNFATVALQQNLLIYDGRALEALNLVNTIVMEANLFSDPELREQALDAIAALRRRRWPMQEITSQRFAVFLLADGNEAATKALAGDLGVDDYFVAPLIEERVELLKRLQTGGRFICYVGSGAESATVTEQALVTLAIPSATNGAMPVDAVEQIASTPAHVVLIEKDIKRLVSLFDIAARFGVSEGFSIAWPLFMDLVDISTTVFIHFGLTYSILFSYSGLLGSALYVRLPLLRYQRKANHKPTQPVDLDRQLADSNHRYE